MAKKGNIDEQMMYNTFNMGIGMVLAVDPEDVDLSLIHICFRACAWKRREQNGSACDAASSE